MNMNDEQLLLALGSGLAGFGGGILADRSYIGARKSMDDAWENFVYRLAKDQGFQPATKKDKQIMELKDSYNSAQEQIKKLIGVEKENKVLNDSLNKARKELADLQGVASANKDMSKNVQELQDQVKRLQMQNQNKSGVVNAAKNLGREVYTWAKTNPGAVLGIGAGAAGLAALPFLMGGKSEKEASYHGSETAMMIKRAAMRKLASIKLSWDENTEYYLRRRVDDLMSAFSSGRSSEADYTRNLADIERTFMVDAARSGFDNRMATATLKRIMPPGYSYTITPAQFAGFGPPPDYRFQVPQQANDFQRYVYDEYNNIINNLNSGRITPEQASAQFRDFNESVYKEAPTSRFSTSFTDARKSMYDINNQLQDKIYKGQLGFENNRLEQMPITNNIVDEYNWYHDAPIGKNNVTLRDVANSKMEDYSSLEKDLLDRGISRDIINQVSPIARHTPVHGGSVPTAWIGANETAGDVYGRIFRDFDDQTSQWMSGHGKDFWRHKDENARRNIVNNWVGKFKKVNGFSNFNEGDQNALVEHYTRTHFGNLPKYVKPRTNPNPTNPNPTNPNPTNPNPTNPNPTNPNPKPTRGPWEQRWRDIQAFAKRNPLPTFAAGAAGALGLAGMGYGAYRLGKKVFGDDDRKRGLRISLD